MKNFVFHNPVKIVFGQGQIASLADLLPADAKVLLVYGGGSIKANGVHEQVSAALEGREWQEFGGIEPNPRYATCMQAVERARAFGAEFLLSAGGGSALDATKFIAAAVPYPADKDPWDIMMTFDAIDAALPLGCVLTLPATGSEMNGNAVVSRESTKEKLFFKSSRVMPQFSILDPATTYTLPERQTANGIVDAFTHVMEQYMTVPGLAPLQDRQCEAILRTLVEEAPKVLAEPDNYPARANIMWCACNALNGLIGCGTGGDWASHRIGHELTALYGLDHAQTLAVLLPAVMRHLFSAKRAKLLQYGRRVWGVTTGDEDDRAIRAIDCTEEFFRVVGMGTRLSEYDVDADDAIEKVPARLAQRPVKVCEHVDLDDEDVAAILELAAE